MGLQDFGYDGIVRYKAVSLEFRVKQTSLGMEVGSGNHPAQTLYRVGNGAD